MSKRVPTKTYATHSGVWVIDEGAGVSIECYVTNDKRRMLSLKGARRTLGLSGAGSTAITRNLSRKWIKPYLTDDLHEWLETVQSKNLERIKTDKGHSIIPLEAPLFVDICKAYINAQRDGLFTDKKGRILTKWHNQNDTANKLFHVMSAFAKVGIIALIDEITGYQEDRDRDEINRLLSLYLAEERLQWAKTFPDEFYKQIYRLRGWHYPTGSTKRTPLLGKITNEIIYKRLPPGVLEELKRRNPVQEATKRRRWKHFQFLSDDIGQPDLRDLLLQEIALMRASSNWRVFDRLLKRAIPMPGDQQALPYNELDDD